MAETFDYVGFAKDFEKRYGRPPSAEELEVASDPLAGIVTRHTPEEVQAELDRLMASYKPSFGERLRDVFGFLGRGFFKAILLIIQTPVYLTLFFFNLIKSAIAVVIMAIITKGVFGVILAEILSIQNIEKLSQAPKLLKFFAQDFMTETLEPIYFTDLDILICVVFTFLLALVLTFSKVERT